MRGAEPRYGTIWMLVPVVAALALCVPAAQAQKQVYRCKTSGGQVNLSDKPCADAASEQVVYAAEPGRVQVKAR